MSQNGEWARRAMQPQACMCPEKEQQMFCSRITTTKRMDCPKKYPTLGSGNRHKSEKKMDEKNSTPSACEQNKHLAELAPPTTKPE